MAIRYTQLSEPLPLEYIPMHTTKIELGPQIKIEGNDLRANRTPHYSIM